MKTLKSLTGTENIYVNILAASALALLAFSIIALSYNCIVDPSLLENASF